MQVLSRVLFRGETAASTNQYDERWGEEAKALRQTHCNKIGPT